VLVQAGTIGLRKVAEGVQHSQINLIEFFEKTGRTSDCMLACCEGGIGRELKSPVDFLIG
jgi:hypothetical protein